MSELQQALLAIGFGVIVAVYLFGWWQQRKYRRKFGEAFKAHHADALYQAPAELVLTPVMPTPPEPQPPAERPQPAEKLQEKVQEEAQLPVPVIEPVISEEIAPQAARMVVAEGALLSEGVCALLEIASDFIVELHPLEPSPASVLGGLWQRKFDFGKPVHLCGLKLNSMQWERAIAESQTLYTRFKIALQLVDRSGAVSAAKLSDFRDLVQGVAKNIRAATAVPDIAETHQRATELDTFCAEVDQMVGINLIPPGERLLQGSKIAQAAAMHGMKLDADGAFHLSDAQGHSEFSLINQNTRPFQHHSLENFSTPGITLLLDVPRVLHPATQFDRMVNIARGLARELQVNMVDDHRVMLSDHGLIRIHEQIVAVEAKMCAYGIIPGSPQARRLFS